MFTENIIAAPATFPMVENSVPLMASPSMNRLQRTNPSQHQDWDAQVAGHPGFSFFHSEAWAKVLTGTYGYKPVYFITSEGGQVQSLLPLMEVDSWLTGRRGIALPFTDDCEPLGNDAVLFKQLFQGAVEFGKSQGWKYVECRGGGKSFEGGRPSLSFWGHRLHLISDLDQLFGSFENRVRGAIKKSAKSSLELEISQSLDAVQNYYQLHCQVRKQHGVPPQSFGFFRNIQQHVLAHNQGIVVSARHQGKIVASAIYFHTDRDAIYKFSASDAAFSQLNANNFVMWEAIKHYVAKGVKTINFGRTSLGNEGLRRYKLGWKTEEYPINYYKFDFRKNAFTTDTDESSGWHNRVFRKLPVFASRMIGDVLYKHWA
jgi:GNAT acetyltransferase-like protein